MTRTLVACFCLVGAVSSAFPSTGMLTLSPATATVNKLKVVFDPGLPSTAYSTLSGTLPVVMDVDPATGKVSGLTITDGRIAGTILKFNGFGYNLTVDGFGAGIGTPAPPCPVTPATGQFDASLFDMTIDQGSVNGTVLGTDLNTAFTPESPATGTGSGTGTIATVFVNEASGFRNYTATLTLPVSVEDTTTTDSGTVTITSTGTIKATGTVSVPKTAYLAWTVAQGMSGASFATVNNRLANGLRWALGLSATGDPAPWLPKGRTDGTRGFVIQLPAAGSGGPLTVEGSTALSGWTALPIARISTGKNPIPAGTTGPVTVTAAGGAKEFIRLRVTEP